MITYRTLTVDGLNVFYREAGPVDAPTLVLLHGFPSSSHMFRELIPALSETFHLVAPDYPGFGQSDSPSIEEFDYRFDHLAEIVEHFLQALGLQRFSLYVQDYGAPIGFRLATKHPEWIQALIVQNGNAYEEGISAAFEPLKSFWAERNATTEVAARALLQRETTIFQYTHGARHPETISPDAWTMDQALLDRPGNDLIQLELLHDYPSNLRRYPEWHAYFRQYQPPTLIVWGQMIRFSAQKEPMPISVISRLLNCICSTQGTLLWRKMVMRSPGSSNGFSPPTSPRAVNKRLSHH